MTKAYKNFRAFFPFYLREHSKPLCRAFHYTGTFLATIALVVFFITGNGWCLLAWPLLGYGFAWGAHAFIEKNRPATFTYPWYSLAADYYMTFLWMTGRLRPHLEAALDQDIPEESADS